MVRDASAFILVRMDGTGVKTAVSYTSKVFALCASYFGPLMRLLKPWKGKARAVGVEAALVEQGGLKVVD